MQLSKQGLQIIYEAVCAHAGFEIVLRKNNFEKWNDVALWLYECLERKECLWEESTK